MLPLPYPLPPPQAQEILRYHTGTKAGPQVGPSEAASAGSAAPKELPAGGTKPKRKGGKAGGPAAAQATAMEEDAEARASGQTLGAPAFLVAMREIVTGRLTRVNRCDGSGAVRPCGPLWGPCSHQDMCACGMPLIALRWSFNDSYGVGPFKATRCTCVVPPHGGSYSLSAAACMLRAPQAP